MVASADRIVTAERTVHASASSLFVLLADPARHVEWGRRDNLASAAEGQTITAAGDTFEVNLVSGVTTVNTVVEFVQDRRIAWVPAPKGEDPSGQLWRWELTPSSAGTRVRHTYDWTHLTGERRLIRALALTAEDLRRSVDGVALAALDS
ncbi:polyketide cyclase [Citricoccus nitrophenolicus]|uniref:polyketide cyclase n=1 Tax=Citricoccus nitrophenolicus TaxID=863575 RepID=UPI0031E72B20